MIDVNYLNLTDLYILRVNINNRIEQIEKDAQVALEAGEDVPEYKLSKPRKVRKILDETTLVQSLGNYGIPAKELYDAKLKGVPALEAIIKDKLPEQHKQLMSELVDVSMSKPRVIYVGEE